MTNISIHNVTDIDAARLCIHDWSDKGGWITLEVEENCSSTGRKNQTEIVFFADDILKVVDKLRAEIERVSAPLRDEVPF
jgi:hypothetical protein